MISRKCLASAATLRLKLDTPVAPGPPPWSKREELVRRGLHAADELPLLLKALEIDEALERTHPLVLRDMERVCTLCRHKARCDMDLTDGTSAEYFSSYCPNESTITQLERTAAAPIPTRRLLSSLMTAPRALRRR
jgi:hypothetical protein